jgi:glutathionylspermidine synthase
MKREILPRMRDNWQEKVEAIGFRFYEMHGKPYWDESVYYAFTSAEIDRLEEVTNDLYEMCLNLVDHVIRDNLYEKIGIPETWSGYIEKSWKEKVPSLYGRFDLRYDGAGEPKLLEFNADTPTALFEASVVQYYWLQDFDSRMDQFNSIHEKLLEVMKKEIKRLVGFNTLYFSCVKDNVEDYTTTEYLRDLAIQAWITTQHIFVDDIGYDPDGQRLVDLDNNAIRYMFKLYPWEWMIREEFAQYLSTSGLTLLEPPWKMILSNKGMLPLLWEMYPRHKNLLPSSYEPQDSGTRYVEKPFFSREGENIRIGTRFSDSRNQVIYQEYAELPVFGGNYPVIGSWIIGSEAAGIGIREDTNPVTNNLSRFVPHLFSG